MPGLIGYDPNRTRELHRHARGAAEHLARLPPCDDPLADTATSVARLVRTHLEHDWLPAIERVVGSTAMLDFSETCVEGARGFRPQSVTHPADDTGPPASNSLDSELNPAAIEESATEPSAPITEVVLPNGWSYQTGPVSASTGQPASGGAWMPPTRWDMAPVLLAASFLPVTGEVLDAYDCVTDPDVPCELIAVPFVSARGVNAVEEALTAGARSTDVIRTFDFDAAESWRLQDTLEDHFERHGPLLGSRSAEHYARQASDFLAHGAIENLPTKIDPKSGRIRIWDPETDTFGVYNPDGTTATFYVLEPEKYGYASSLDYWEDQPG